MANETTQDQDFLAATPKEQHAYLMATDPDYAKASPQEQVAYLQSVSPQLKETQFEKDRTTPARLGAANEVAGMELRGAGLPAGLSDVPRWAKGMVGPLAGGKPWWESITSGPEAGSPESTPLGRAATLTGMAAGAAGAGEVRPGLRAAKPELAELTRTPTNKLTPGTRAVATTLGGATGYSVLPEHPWLGAGAGARMGPTVADWVLPKRAIQPPMADIPEPESPGSVLGGGQQGLRPSGVSVFPEPREPMPGDRPGSAWSLKRPEELPEAAQRGSPGAGDVLKNLKPVLYTPREGVGYPGPRLGSQSDMPPSTPSTPVPEPEPQQDVFGSTSAPKSSPTPPPTQTEVPEGAVFGGPMESEMEAARRGAPGVNPTLRSLRRQFEKGEPEF